MIILTHLVFFCYFTPSERVPVQIQQKNTRTMCMNIADSVYGHCSCVLFVEFGQAYSLVESQSKPTVNP